MVQAVIYTRVSSREQQQEGFSLGAQSKLLREYADRSAFEIVKSFEDVETAKATGRKQFTEMVNWLKNNRSCRTLIVEKTDRLYRNFRDAVTLEDLDIEIHFVKEGSTVSKDSRSQTRLIQGIHLVLARNYSENLREEVKKGMREKAAQGFFPGLAPFGYRNNKAERTIEIDPVDSAIVTRMFELYATGAHSLTTLAKAIRIETGKKISRGNVWLILKNLFYVGTFQWGGQSFAGKHDLFLAPRLFQDVQSVLAGQNRPRYSTKREVAFRGLMHCAYDGCTLTGDVQKVKYVYYRCTGYRGKCALPRFREEDLARRLGEPLKAIQVPEPIVADIIAAIRDDESTKENSLAAQRAGFERRLSSIHSQMDRAYSDKLDGTIPTDFWERKMSDWRAEEQRVKMAMDGLKCARNGDRALAAQEIFELANGAYSLYISQNPQDQAKLLRTVLSNCAVDSVSLTPTYREPFDMIFKRAQKKEWSGRLDSN